MKNFKFLLILAIVLGLSSAFTVEENLLPIYVKIGSTYQLAGPGICRNAPTVVCNYTIIDPYGSMTDDSNFEIYSYGRWTPLDPGLSANNQ